MKPYTVIVMRPTWACNYPRDTFMETAMADSPAAALAKVRQLAVEADTDEEFTPNGEDYFCIAVIEGDHSDLNPE